MRHLALMLLLTLVAQAACKPDDAATSEQTDRGPRPDVNLPPVPEIDTVRPMVHPDGSLTIWALSQRMSEYLGQNVRVTAYAKEIYICETRGQQMASDRMIRDRLYLTEDEMAELEQVAQEAAGTGQGTGETERCLYPHMFVADDVTSERTILVTGYGVPLEERLRVGDRYVLEGRFIEETRGFNAAGRGLIYVYNVSGGNLDLPPPEGGEEPESIEIR